MPEEFLMKISRLADKTDTIIPKVLDAGAEVVESKVQRKVTAIPATISRYTATPINSTKKRRVDGYARVSTDHEDQTTSYEAQVDYYTNYIKSRDDWEFVAIYTDEGISATNTKKREGLFCAAGKKAMQRIYTNTPAIPMWDRLQDGLLIRD